MPYASRVDPTEDVRIVLADERYCEALADLVSRIEAEDHPNDAQAATQAPSGMAESLSRYDALSADSAWFMIAYRSDQPAGLAVLTRVPKLDERTGFLYVGRAARPLRAPSPRDRHRPVAACLLAHTRAGTCRDQPPGSAG